VFYTPGWGIVLTVTGTLGGVIITQAANSWSTRGARRRERNDRISDAVGDLIAGGNGWVYALDACEQIAYNAVTRKIDQVETMATLTSARADVRSAQLAFSRALARVRLTCPQGVSATAEDYRAALQAFDDEVVAKVRVMLESGRADAVQRSVPEEVAAPQDRLCHETRKATGR
jgi:hypothetical protein